jgi:quercetin dioxygenase-like cupin family protein
MPLDIRKSYFESKDDVLADLQKTGFWPTTFVSNESPELPLHWHDEDVHGYVLEGETYLLDEGGERVPFGVGDKLVLPKGTVHAEGAVTGRMVYIVAMKEPSNLEVLLRLRDPAERPAD